MQLHLLNLPNPALAPSLSPSIHPVSNFLGILPVLSSRLFDQPRKSLVPLVSLIWFGDACIISTRTTSIATFVFNIGFPSGIVVSTSNDWLSYLALASKISPTTHFSLICMLHRTCTSGSMHALDADSPPYL